jgi:predicted metal-dependent HD superfamily phosphohydrolase
MTNAGSFQVRESDIELLKGQWRALTARYAGDDSESDACFTSIVQNYSAPGRVYHNLSHIKALTALYVEFKTGADCDAVWLAIWYHDVVYETGRADNEEASVELASQALSRLRVPVGTIAEVEKMILATKHHSAEHLSADGQLFLDLDISIVGAPPELYKEYSRAIRREYHWLPWPMYRAGRSKILSDFLRRQQIFFTDRMNARLEDQARRNLEEEVKELVS